eukprot:COSAG05_NODE_3309_length_2159_cov_2.161165_1_plen_87_part_10
MDALGNFLVGFLGLCGWVSGCGWVGIHLLPSTTHELNEMSWAAALYLLHTIVTFMIRIFLHPSCANHVRRVNARALKSVKTSTMEA